ncbi:DUF2147 domain-containing protein [Bradyrhizobium sp. BR13661]|jgi:hypothetical protein|uniref:DUF2147 domain-containing protein n=1 Tax=Bradyrhizobium sp. BR13661 TaxID=2940622 RepID=UPI002473BE97|nr:DUF2147 domain-containing protein [Bradyrhizobium sp. BR13661]MDH6259386.1 hypothetical protein [Bradyrhizobium sp. BR13661]
MKRLAATLLGALTVLTAVASAAQAGSYNFTIDGHRIRVEAPRNCRSMSCVSISTDHKSFEDADTTPAPPPAPTAAPVVQAPQPVAPAAPVRPPQATVTAPPPPPPPLPAPVLAATNSRPVVMPQQPKLEAPKFEALSTNPPRVDLSRNDTPIVPQSDQTVGTAPRSDDVPAYMPLGEWESDGAKSGDKSPVRIERCGAALCGYALTGTSTRGENVLVNMKQQAHDVWTGNIYSRSSGDTYYGTMTLKNSGKLYVEACAFGHFWCSGNDWTRVEEVQEKLTTTWR